MDELNLSGLAGMTNNHEKPRDQSARKTAYNQPKPQPYLGAPYNFVPIEEKPFDYEKNGHVKVGHNSTDQALYTGEIDYQIQAQTPILVDGGKKDVNGKLLGKFYQDCFGNYAIPGSTVRGLVRSNAMILSNSEFSDDISDYALMYRNVASGAEKKHYNDVLGNESLPLNLGNGKKINISVLKNVKAGYITCRAGKYKILPVVLDKAEAEDNSEQSGCSNVNYYILNERKIIHQYLDNKKGNYRYQALINPNHNMLQHELKEFTKVTKEERVSYQGISNRGFQPFYKKISYELSGKRDVTDVALPGVLSKKGYVLVSGYMREKKAVYIIPEVDEKKGGLDIPTKDIDAFRIDYRAREQSIKRCNSNGFFDLPREEEIKPVFYIHIGERLYFGFTPRLRLFYDKTIKEGLKQNSVTMDYCKAIFGYSTDQGSLRSRVSFENAVIQNEVAEKELPENETSRILAAPKPTCYLNYIQPADGDRTHVATYNDDFKLRGIKQYWLKNKIEPENKTKNEQNQTKKKNTEVWSKMKPLSNGTTFAGKVHFNNLTKDELGLLIWSLRLEDDSEQNIGKGKPYGYGRIKVEIQRVTTLDYDKAYCVNELSLDPVTELKSEELIQDYQKYITGKIGRDIKNQPSIQQFLLMKKNGNGIPSNEKTKYMELGKKNEGGFYEQKSKNVLLPTIKEVLAKE